MNGLLLTSAESRQKSYFLQQQKTRWFVSSKQWSEDQVPNGPPMYTPSPSPTADGVCLFGHYDMKTLPRTSGHIGEQISCGNVAAARDEADTNFRHSEISSQIVGVHLSKKRWWTEEKTEPS